MNRNDGVADFGRELRIGTEQLLLEQTVVVVGSGLRNGTDRNGTERNDVVAVVVGSER